MYNNKGRHVVILIFLTAFLLFPLKLQAEFYKYVDKDGRLYFVDDKGNVPPEYRDDVKVYREKYDHLSEEERVIMQEKDHQRAEEMQEALKKEEGFSKYLKIIEKQREEQIAKEEAERHRTTKVVINGNKVLVPVVLGYGQNEVDTLLLLDTGASIVVVHKDIAEQLNIRRYQSATAQVTGGKLIPAKMAKLSYVKVGPIEKKDLTAGVIRHKGPPVDYNGLLGMNFLRGVDYSIDFKRQIIKWNP